jgi:hypothetical protein
MKTELVVQVLAGILAACVWSIVGLFGLGLLDAVSPSSSSSDNQHTQLIRGYANGSELVGTSFNGSNPLAPNFRPMPKSINRRGGASFTYRFWLKVTDEQSVANQTLFLKGDPRAYKVGLYDPQSLHKVATLPTQRVVACPAVAFGASYRDMVVKFNTLNNPFNAIEIKMQDADDAATTATPAGRRNALSLLALKDAWFLISVVVEDDAAPSGVRVRCYVNDFLYQENGPEDTPSLRGDALKQNDGDLVLFPDGGGGKGVQIGDLTYINRASTVTEIAQVFRAGPPARRWADLELAPTSTQKYRLSAYNKVDVFNF